MGALFVSHAAAQNQTSVTPVSGESWITHLRRPLEETSMGKTGLLGPATLETSDADQNKTRSARLRLASGNQSTILQGVDLYRLNCRACHGEFGLGASPEINSVIDAARATYAPFTRERLRKLGLETTRKQANELANQAKGALLERLHNGGVDMPPFPQLSEPEARAIFAYLRHLADIPAAGAQQIRVEEPSLRVGEHIVKSTCHICHSAAGVNPSPEELMQGAIPPLSSLTTRVSLPEFERKVRHGAPIQMGSPVLPYRGRMPVFNYLSQREVADAYLYLTMYPPSAWADPGATPEKTPQASIPIASAGEPSTSSPPREVPTVQAGVRKAAVVPIIAGILVALQIFAGAIFTVYEVKRSRPRTMRILGMGGARRSMVSPEFFAQAKRVPHDSHKQAAWHSRLDRSEHDVFESSWFARRLKNEDGAA
jgi:mono/diheme cytochrome c family protein